MDHDGLCDSSFPIKFLLTNHLSPFPINPMVFIMYMGCHSIIHIELPDCLFVFTDSLLQCPASFPYVQFLVVFAWNFIDDSFSPVFGYPILDSHQHLSDCSARFEYCSHVYTFDGPAYIVNLLRQASHVWYNRVLFSLLSSVFSLVLVLVWLALSTLLRMGSRTFCGKLLDWKASSRCLISSCRYSLSQMLTGRFLRHFTTPARTLRW